MNLMSTLAPAGWLPLLLPLLLLLSSDRGASAATAKESPQCKL
eukprot:jgi/Chlat1/1576/Chrsp123S01843